MEAARSAGDEMHGHDEHDEHAKHDEHEEHDEHDEHDEHAKHDEHEEHDEHAKHDEHEHDESGAAHSEFHAHYHFECDGAPLQTIRLTLFDTWPRIEKIQLQALTPNGQTGGNIEADNPLVSLP